MWVISGARFRQAVAAGLRGLFTHPGEWTLLPTVLCNHRTSAVYADIECIGGKPTGEVILHWRTNGTNVYLPQFHVHA